MVSYLNFLLFGVEQKRLIQHLVPSFLVLKAKPQLAPPMVELARSRSGQRRRHWHLTFDWKKQTKGEGHVEKQSVKKHKNEIKGRVNSKRQQWLHHLGLNITIILVSILFSCIVFKIRYNKTNEQKSVSVLPLNSKSAAPQLLVTLSHNTRSKLKTPPVKCPWGEVKSLWHHHYIWPSHEGGDTWRAWEWMGGEGGWVNGGQVGQREWGLNEQVDFRRRSGIPQGKLCFNIQLSVASGTPLSCWSETIGCILSP